MMTFSRPSNVPPDGFQWVDPITGVFFKAHVFSLLRDQVTEHRSGNGLPPVSDEEMQDQNCRRLPESARKEFCQGDTENGVNAITLGFNDIVRGTEAIIRTRIGGELVSQDEANRRASICATCPYNARYRNPCGSAMCNEMKRLVVALVGGNKTTHDEAIHGCAVCKCVLKAKVWVPESVIRAVDGPEIAEKYPENCWLFTKTT